MYDLFFQVSKFLNDRYAGRYHIINVSERATYDKVKYFEGRVTHFKWNDSHAPPFSLLFDVCRLAEEWITSKFVAEFTNIRQQRQCPSGSLQCRKRSNRISNLCNLTVHEIVQRHRKLSQTFWLSKIFMHKGSNITLLAQIFILFRSIFQTKSSFALSEAVEGHTIRESTQYIWRRSCSDIRCILVQ